MPKRLAPSCYAPRADIVSDLSTPLDALGEPLEVARRLTGAERFEKMSKAEQDDALGPETADAVRAGKIKLRDLVAKDPLGRVEQESLGDAL